MSDEASTKKEAMAGVFDRAAPTYGQTGPRFFSLYGKKLVEFAGLEPGDRVLDVASGRGAVLFPAAEKVGEGGHVTGVDIAPKMIEALQADIAGLGLSNAEAIVMDAENLDFPDASFDAVLSGFSIFFMPDPLRAMREFHRVLKPGGLFGTTTWGRSDARWKWIDDLFETYLPKRDAAPPSPFVNNFNQPDSMRSLMGATGFDRAVVEERDDVVYYTDAEDWWATQWSHGMRARFETLGEEARQAYKQDAFRKISEFIEPAGAPMEFNVLYSFGRKPGE